MGVRRVPPECQSVPGDVKMTSETNTSSSVEAKHRSLHQSKGSGTSITSSSEYLTSQSSDEQFRSRSNSPPSLYQQVLRQQGSHIRTQKNRRSSFDRHTSKQN